MEKPMKGEKVPETDSIRELARFWETHDLTDFEDQMEEVTEPVFERKTLVNIHLRPEEMKAVKEIAMSRGVDSADLVREWVLEKIQK